MAPRVNGITRFGLRNFKAFRYLEDIELKPLTLLVGANSSGKSSIFQSLLLLKQTLLSSSGTGALKFDGDWVKLGGFSSVISDFDVSKALEYRFFVLGDVGSLRLPTPLASTASTGKSSMRRRRVRVESEVSFSLCPLEQNGLAVIKELSMTLAGRGGDPSYPRLRIDRAEADLGSQKIPLDEVVTEQMFSRTLPDLAWLDSILMIGSKYRVEGAYDGLLRDLREYLATRLDYLGPVRADPRPFYPISEEPEVGVRGEGAIPYLLKQRSKPVTFALGPTGELQQAPLFDALNHWLRHMRVAPGLSIETVESIAYTAAIHTPLVKGRPVNLAQVGFGVSQLLPVLLQGLRNPTDAWILFEQPEIHLHPRLQAELGDFFLASARTGKTLMVETHSDHMVHRIRRRIAEDTTGELADLVQILFVHAGTEEDPGSYVEPLRVGPDGSIENWPDDFLSESADEALAILRARRARAK